MENLSNIQQFYYGKNVFITGATGFFGKILVEKLLRCCPGIQKLYLLVREHKGKNIHTRFDEILSDPLFNTLEQTLPEYKQKIILINGDCSQTNLGLSTSDIKVLLEQVNVIFHAAATVKFNEHLRIALNINVKATSELVLLAKHMQHLDVFMYISTAYSHAHLPLIEEEFYPPGMELSQCQEMIKNQTDDEIEKILPKILGPWPNTYTFTKAMAENEILTKCEAMPVGIFRPAIVISTAEQPIKNWIDNFSGPTTIVVFSGMGLLHTLHCDENMTTDLVPGDYAVNCVIAAASDVHRAFGQRSNIPPKPLIYNYVSSVENRITWGEYKAYFMAGLDEYPFSIAVWYKFLMFNKIAIINFFFDLLLHVVPALLARMLLILGLQNRRMVTAFKRLQMYTSILMDLMTRNFKFCNKRTRKLWEDCSDLDKKLFPFCVADLKWSEYFKEYTLGIRRYLLKEKDEDLPQARRKLKRLYYLHNTIKLFYLIFLTFIVCCTFKVFLR